MCKACCCVARDMPAIAGAGLPSLSPSHQSPETIRRRAARAAHQRGIKNDQIELARLFDAVKPKRRREKHVPKPRPMSPERLDARLAASKQFKDIVSGIAVNWSGQRKRGLADAFAGVAMHISDLNARLLLGEKVDAIQHARMVSTLVELATLIDAHDFAKEPRT